MLTDEQIDEEWFEVHHLSINNVAKARLFASAIEAAACAERDARIAELEQRNRDLHEDVQRFKEHALSEKDARLALERELAEARKDAERWQMMPAFIEDHQIDYVRLKKDIDAAMKGQQ